MDLKDCLLPKGYLYLAITDIKYFLAKYGLAKGDIIVECNGEVIPIESRVY